MEEDVLQLEKKIYDILHTVYDPEIPVNIYDLGLIYDVDIDEYNNVEITMTLTAPNCPVADNLVAEVRDRIADLSDTNKVSVNLTFDPPWEKSMMSEQAMLELGFL